MLIIAGHIVLATPFGVPALFVSIMLIVFGTGMLKPNVSGMVGHLYSKLTYVEMQASPFLHGINIGALIAPLVVGTLGQEYNYHLGFSVAAVGMFFGLLQYYFQGRKSLAGIGQAPTNPMSKEEQKKFAKAFMLAIVVALLILVAPMSQDI